MARVKGFRKSLKDNGAAMVEYAVVLGLILIGSITFILKVGPNLKKIWTKADSEISLAEQQVNS